MQGNGLSFRKEDCSQRSCCEKHLGNFQSPPSFHFYFFVSHFDYFFRGMNQINKANVVKIRYFSQFLFSLFVFGDFVDEDPFSFFLQ